MRKTILTKPLFTMLCLAAGICTHAADKKAGGLSTHMPAVFIENKGQIVNEQGNTRTDIDYQFCAAGVTLFVDNSNLHYLWQRPEKGTGKVESYRLDVKLLGSDPASKIITEGKLDYYENYFLAQCPQGITAYAYNKITYKDVYPGIDWVLYTKNDKLEYDFIVHPGADPKQIRLQYDGATRLAIEAGLLKASSPLGKIEEHKPYSYIKETREYVASSYKLENNILSFDVNAKDNGTLVIDPVLTWSNYYGLPDTAIVQCITADKNGNVFIGGSAGVGNDPAITSLAAHQQYFGGVADGFLVKFNSVGVRQWGTYYGGTSQDEIKAVTCDTFGNIYIGGYTQSSSAISFGSSVQQPAYSHLINGSNPDGFLVKLNTFGTRIWGTYYGGRILSNNAGSDLVLAVTCDIKGNVYIGGSTETPATGNVMYTAGTAQTTQGNGFIAKFDPSNGSRIWGTYYGEQNSTDRVTALVCDTMGNLYATGATGGGTTIPTSGAHQTTYGGGADAYLAKFYAASGTRQWSTFYGGSSLDLAYAIACDPTGNGIYIGGITNSTNSGNAIATSGASQTSPGADVDGFLVKFNSSGVRQWGTYYGGNQSDEIKSIVVRPDGKIYVAGNTGSTTGISTTGAFSTSFNGWVPPPMPPPFHYGDGFFAKFTPGGVKQWGSYFGGSRDESNTLVAYAAGKFYLTGTTTSEDKISPTYTPPSPAPPLPYFPNPASYITQFEADTAVFLYGVRDTTYCVKDSFTISYGVINPFRTGNVFYVQLSDVNGNFTNGALVGAVLTSTEGNLKFGIPAGTTPGTNYRIRMISDAPADTSDDNGKNIRIADIPIVKAATMGPVCGGGVLTLADTSFTTPANSYKWTGPNLFVSYFQTYNYVNVPFSASGLYTLEADNFGCKATSSVNVVVTANPAKPKITSNSPVCSGDTLKISAKSATPGALYNWIVNNDPNSYKQDAPGDTVIPNSTVGDGLWYKVVSSVNGCVSDLDSFKAVVNQSVTPTITANASPGTNVAEGTALNFSGAITNGGTAPKYQWYKNGSAIPGQTGNTLSATAGVDVKNGDVICVKMTSNALCAKPDTASSCTTMSIFPVGITDLNSAGSISVYPNPNKGTFTLKANTGTSTNIGIEVWNTIGQLVYQGEASPVKGYVEHTIKLEHVYNGLYMLKLSADNDVRTVRFIVGQ